MNNETIQKAFPLKVENYDEVLKQKQHFMKHYHKRVLVVLDDRSLVANFERKRLVKGMSKNGYSDRVIGILLGRDASAVWRMRQQK